MDAIEDAIEKAWPAVVKNLPPVIGLYAPVMQSGKTFTAEYLMHKHHFILHKFAAPMKAMLWELFKALDLPPARCLEGDLKETPLPQLGGKTPRFAHQSIGTEWGRKMIDEDLWVRIAMYRIGVDNQNRSHPVVVDDVRQPNEYEALAALPNSILVKIIRPGETPYSAHGSEGLLEDHTFDFTIINNSTPEALYRMVENVLHLGRSQGARALGIKELRIEP